jgi:hypothetical protein
VYDNVIAGATAAGEQSDAYLETLFPAHQDCDHSSGYKTTRATTQATTNCCPRPVKHMEGVNHRIQRAVARPVQVHRAREDVAHASTIGAPSDIGSRSEATVYRPLRLDVGWRECRQGHKTATRRILGNAVDPVMSSVASRRGVGDQPISIIVGTANPTPGHIRSASFNLATIFGWPQPVPVTFSVGDTPSPDVVLNAGDDMAVGR